MPNPTLPRSARSTIVVTLTIVLAMILTACNNSEPTAPTGSNAFGVQSIAVYDGQWKDPTIGVWTDYFAGKIGTVHSIRLSPHNQNTIVVAGEFCGVRAGAKNQLTGGLTLFFLSGGSLGLGEGDPDFIECSGSFFDATFDPNNGNGIFAGLLGEYSLTGNRMMSTFGEFDQTSRLWHQRPEEEYFYTGNAYCVERIGNSIYVGGDFVTTDGTQDINSLFRYDIATTSPITMDARLQRGSPIYAIKPDGSNIIVGGVFQTIGGVSANNIALWNGGSWQALGEGLNGTVNDIIVHEGKIYAAGRFTGQDYMNFYVCARFDGTHWTFLGAPFTYETSGGIGEGRALAVYNNRVTLGGRFRQLDGNTVRNVAQWDDASNKWQGMGGGIDNEEPNEEFPAQVNTLEVVSNRLYVGGYFDFVRVN